eukprot:CAMPEP_0168593064 /NCGR_PEP_ID=MMETSP0420-20121227/8093_1 /TAXON_ID=498008 /ORGANISM="Pessonella sp." /LENGTH=344 /DNA_ID=CAMNT_0008629147 /DNA_START=31 /DNA_END=1062 /DNA_ORIENTATION=-
MSETDSANRSRRNMTKHQTLVLNQAFVQEMKPPHNYYRELGTLIGLTPKQVRIWFQNKRARLKKTGGPVTGPYRAKNYPNGKTLACANIKLPPMHPPNKDHAKKSATSKRTSHLLDGGSTTTTTTTSSTASSKPKKRRAKTAPGTKQASKRRPTSVDSSTTALSGLIALSQASTQLGLHPDDSPPSTQHNTSNLKRSSGAVVLASPTPRKASFESDQTSNTHSFSNLAADSGSHVIDRRASATLSTGNESGSSVGNTASETRRGATDIFNSMRGGSQSLVGSYSAKDLELPPTLYKQFQNSLKARKNMPKKETDLNDLPSSGKLLPLDKLLENSRRMSEMLKSV